MWIAILTILLYAMALVCLYSLWAIWPSGSAGAAAGSVPIALFGQSFTVTTDEQMFGVVALAGALGGIVHSLRSVGWYAGNRALKWSWVASYLLLPAVGALGGTIFYIVARGGLLPSSQPTAPPPNAYGFAAVAALVGLFSDQAFIKLKAVAETLFDKAEEGENHVAPKNTTPGG